MGKTPTINFGNAELGLDTAGRRCNLARNEIASNSPGSGLVCELRWCRQHLTKGKNCSVSRSPSPTRMFARSLIHLFDCASDGSM